MKRIFILAGLYFLTSCAVSAQTTKGSKMLGGSVSYESYTNDNGTNPDYKRHSFYFDPTAGYFIADNVALGLTLGLGTSGSSQDQNDWKYFGFNVGPMFRWYKATSNEKFYFFVHGAVGLGKSNQESDNGFTVTEFSTTWFNANVYPGFAYFFNEHWSAELAVRGIAFSREEYDNDSEENVSTKFTFGVESFTPSLGLRFYF
jgi:outer membrane protein